MFTIINYKMRMRSYKMVSKIKKMDKNSKANNRTMNNNCK